MPLRYGWRPSSFALRLERTSRRQAFTIGDADDEPPANSKLKTAMPALANVFVLLPHVRRWRRVRG